ncbi:MAG: hypothetical protein KJ971_03565 [Firmicutes bacterium]|nr:hypothetical protein [Bacillota bacterium]
MEKMEHNGFNKEDILSNGNKYLIANGYFGYRGTLEEFSKNEMVEFNLNGLYDQFEDRPRESVNAFNPLFTYIKVGQTLLNPLETQPISHLQGLDMENGIHYRKTAFKIDEATIIIKSERFADQIHKNFLYSKYSFSATEPMEIDIYTGIDSIIYDASGSHFKNIHFEQQEDCFLIEAFTNELEIPLVVGESILTNFSCEWDIVLLDNKAMRHTSLTLKPRAAYTIYKFAGVVHSAKKLKAFLIGKINRGKRLGFEKLLLENKHFWKKKWKIANVEISGNPEADQAIKNCIYHLISNRPYSDKVSIPIRGLSGQALKGAVRWDTEILMLPFYLNTDIESARHIIMYRIHGLKGALKKAKDFGYSGAFYALESQEEGFDASRDYNRSTQSSKKKNKDFFKEKQIHINGTIVYALKNYLDRTEDFSVLFEGGLRMILEIARFYQSCLTYNQETDLYDVFDVIGLDEFHERVNNNAYTNYLIKNTFEVLLECMKLAKSKNQLFVSDLLQKLDYSEDIKKVKVLLKHLYIPFANSDGIIEPFQGYFQLENNELKKDAINSKIVKQADVMALLSLFKDDFSTEVKKANFYYYEPKTLQDSSIFQATYALVACNIGEFDSALSMFLNSANCDLYQESNPYENGIYKGGIHPSTHGGAYLSVIYGFAGLTHHHTFLKSDVCLPKKMRSIVFKVILKQKIATVKVVWNKATITWGDLK